MKTCWLSLSRSGLTLLHAKPLEQTSGQQLHLRNLLVFNDYQRTAREPLRPTTPTTCPIRRTDRPTLTCRGRSRERSAALPRGVRGGGGQVVRERARRRITGGGIQRQHAPQEVRRRGRQLGDARQVIDGRSRR